MRRIIPSYVRVPVLFFTIFGLIEFFVDSGDEFAIFKYPVILLFLLLVLLILIAIEAVIGALESVMFQSLDDHAKERYLATQNQKPKIFIWLNNTWIKLVGTKPIEEEGEIILDHNYDGIKELDNDLPPWWIYGFYVSIIFAAVYLIRFHIFNGDNQYEELQASSEQAKVDLEDYKKTAKNLVDYNTVVVSVDATDLANGKKLFQANCVACHRADGGGGIGPNLTDSHWILGGGIKNIFHTISEGGRNGKGMIAWKQSLKSSEMAQLASYVITLEGTVPLNPKTPEGDVWVHENAPKIDIPSEAIEIKTDSVINIEN